MKCIMQDEEWSEAVEGWADKKVKTYLAQNHKEYQELWKRSGDLCEKYPIIDSLVCGSEPIRLTAEDHRRFVEYLDVKDQIEQMEKECHFYLGLAATLPFGWTKSSTLGWAEKVEERSRKRKNQIIDLLAEGRMEGSDRMFRSADEKNQKREKKILELEEGIRALGLPEETFQTIDAYVSEINAQWLKYSEFMYRYGIEDILVLFG